jgi:hypothetical protein
LLIEATYSYISRRQQLKAKKKGFSEAASFADDGSVLGEEIV